MLEAGIALLLAICEVTGEYGGAAVGWGRCWGGYGEPAL